MTNNPCGLQHMGANTPEVRSLKDGEYVGVRRFTRILERGTEAKSDLDTVIDRCGSLVNLRTAIMPYRKPRRWFRFYRLACIPARQSMLHTFLIAAHYITLSPHLTLKCH